MFIRKNRTDIDLTCDGNMNTVSPGSESFATCPKNAFLMKKWMWIFNHTDSYIYPIVLEENVLLM